MTTTEADIKTEEKIEEKAVEGSASETPGPSAGTEAPPKESGGKKAPEPAPPTLNFASFILSLSSSALMSLGVVENPVTGKKEKEPAVAKQTIDLIALLKEKTAGNLDEGESKLMDDVLGELRLWYCRVVG
jgi:hypothetical protein